MFRMNLKRFLSKSSKKVLNRKMQKYYLKEWRAIKL
jgi:hypothetical protein